MADNTISAIILNWWTPVAGLGALVAARMRHVFHIHDQLENEQNKRILAVERTLTPTTSMDGGFERVATQNDFHLGLTEIKAHLATQDDLLKKILANGHK